MAFTLHSALVTPFPALLYGHTCPQVSGAPFSAPRPARRRRFSPNPSSAFGVYPPWRAVSAVKERRVLRRCFFATSYPQRHMHIRPCQKPLNSGQNRSKRRRFPSKSDQKGAQFVMPILTFWGVTPSGASARAVFAFRKGHFRVVQGSKMACGKVIHKMWKTGNRDSGPAPGRVPGPSTLDPLPSSLAPPLASA